LVLSPTGSIYLGFTTEGRLAVVLITPSLGVPNWSVIYIINAAPSISYNILNNLLHLGAIILIKVYITRYFNLPIGWVVVSIGVRVRWITN
jgi:hypothetical protein